MNYSLKTEFGKPDREGRKKVYIRVTVNRKLYRIPADVYSKTDILDKQKKIVVENKKHELEGKIIKSIQLGKPVTLDVLNGEFQTNVIISNYIDTLIERLSGKLSNGRIRHYKSFQNKIDIIKSGATFSDISPAFLESFETALRKNNLSANTISSQIRLFKAIINRAIIEGLADSKCTFGYKNPKTEENIPIYLEESELKSFEKIVFNYGQNIKKIIGYYFLLSCYTGYRISDIFKFNPQTHIQSDSLVIRATKNKRVVTIPIHMKLKNILDYIAQNPLNISEDKFRKYVKDIAKDAGIKKEIKVHSGRHTFAMTLMAKGFTVDEVAEYLGDTVKVAAIYARVSPKILDHKIMNAFK